MKYILISLLFFSLLLAQEENSESTTNDNTETNVANESVENEATKQQLIEMVEPFPTVTNSQATCKLKAIVPEQIKEITASVSGSNEIISGERQGEDYTFIWEASQDGIYTLSIVVEDISGNKEEQSFPVRFDTTPPKITWEESESITKNREVTISILVEDSLQVDSVKLFSQGDYVAEFSKQNEKWQCTQSLQKEGVQSYYVEAQDILGNKGKSEEIKFIYDITPPFIKSVEITPQELQIGILRVSVAYEDSVSGISGNMVPKAYLEVGESQQPLEVIEKDSGKCTFEILVTEDISPGAYTIYVENISDLANNTLGKELLGNVRISDKSEGGNWPFFPQNEVRSILEGKDGSIYIKGEAKEKIASIEDGKVVAISSSSLNESGFVLVQQLRGEYVWGYYNILAVKNSELNRHWALGDIIKKGDVIGALQENSSLQLKLLQESENGWKMHDKTPVEFLNPVAPANMITAMVKEPKAQQNFPEKMQTSDWLLVSYVGLFVLTLLISILPKKVKP